MKTVKVNNMFKSRALRSQNGQIAIFLVLVFQVLFVFFAMTINVGLVVYDKINLQNATDLGAYYAAQKQAELLNQIGHVNYQIRQAFKLLAFRIRVIGSLSVGVGIPNPSMPPHPLFFPPDLSKEGTPFFDKLAVGGRRAPGVCMGSTLWHDYYKNDPDITTSLCRTLDPIKGVTRGGGTAGFGLSGDLDSFLAKVTSEQKNKCKQVSVFDWQLATGFLLAFRIEAEKREEMIRKLANNLSKPAQEMADIRGQSVYNGTSNTVKKNLTDAQAEALDVQLINSMSADVPGPCSDSNYWLPKMNIFPITTYVRMEWVGSGTSAGCYMNVEMSNGGAMPPASYIAEIGGRDNNLLANVWNSSSSVPIGVEKNPWCMTYMGVKARTSPRKIFAPFGGTVNLQAQSFAKPFGGRIGPWYSKQWTSGTGNSTGDPVDPLIPSRDVGSGTAPAGMEDHDIANYSKYPGDDVGLNSAYSLGAMNDYWQTTLIPGHSSSKLVPTFALKHYEHVGDLKSFEADGDSLVRTNGYAELSADPVRRMEEAAVAPDLFDIVYYSIDNQYANDYYNSSNPNFQSFVRPYYPDLGAKENRAPYSLTEQIMNSKEVYNKDIFYVVNNPDQTLTGWTQQKANDYSFPDHFGKCLKRQDGDAENPAPSGCPQGGRSGYSVKIVSKKYLQNVDAELGGPGISGPILNPPPEE